MLDGLVPPLHAMAHGEVGAAALNGSAAAAALVVVQNDGDGAEKCLPGASRRPSSRRYCLHQAGRCVAGAQAHLVQQHQRDALGEADQEEEVDVGETRHSNRLRCLPCTTLAVEQRARDTDSRCWLQKK